MATRGYIRMKSWIAYKQELYSLDIRMDMIKFAAHLHDLDLVLDENSTVESWYDWFESEAEFN